MGTKVKVALAATLVVAVAAVGGVMLEGPFGGEASGADEVRPAREVAAAAEVAGEGPLLATEERTEARTVVGGGEEGGWVVSGTTWRGYEAPLPGVELHAWMSAGWREDGELLAEAWIRSDEEGRFRWSVAAPASMVRIVLQPVSPDIRGNLVEVVPEGEPAPTNLSVLLYPLDVTITGRVVDTQGMPLAGATVVATDKGARTDDQGRYRLRFPSAWSHLVLWAVAPGHAEEHLHFRPRGPGTIAAPDLVLAGGFQVVGRVRNAEGAPIEKASVRLFLVADGYVLPTEAAEVRTDSEGRFSLDFLRSEVKQEGILVTAVGYVGAGAQVIPGKIPAAGLEIVLQRGTDIRGRVVGEHGIPLGGVRLSIGTPAGGTAEAWSSREGEFLLSPVAEGRQTLYCSRRGLRSQKLEIDVPAPGSGLTDVTIAMPAGRSIVGQVLDDRDQPVRGATILGIAGTDWRSGRASDRPRADHVDLMARTGGSSQSGTDERGFFRIEGLSGVSDFLWCVHPGYLSIQHFLSPEDFSQEALVLRLSPAGRLSGRVVDETSGAPLPRFTIRVLEGSGYGSVWGRSGIAFSDENGAWSIEGEELRPEGEYVVEASSPGYAPEFMECVAVVEPDPDTVVLRLERSATIRGWVVDSQTGIPLAGVMIWRFTPSLALISAMKAGERYSTSSDVEGRFTLDGVPGGETSLAVERDGRFLALDGPFPVRPGTVVDRTIVARGGGRIEGRLLDAAGTALVGERIQIVTREASGRLYCEWEATTNEEGLFRFAGLLDGTYELRWQRGLGEREITPLARLVPVRWDETTTLDLRPLGATTLTGRAVGLPDLDAPIPLFLAPRGSSTTRGTDDWRRRCREAVLENGRFRIEGLEAGAYVLTSCYEAPDGGGRWDGRLEVDLPAEGVVEVELRFELRQ
ncbi:MAG: carboxypeptidase-like regulatory domain-containing protein [Planctomycetota bacterium]